MQIRHSSLLARVRFLQTRSEPNLVCYHAPYILCFSRDSLTSVQYYKPWELLPGDEAIIKRQIEEAEDIIQNETLQLVAENPPANEDPTSAADGRPPETSELPADPSETVGSATNVEERSGSEKHNDTNPGSKSPDMSNTTPKAIDSSGILKDHGDDAGEIVLEGEEDTVIY